MSPFVFDGDLARISGEVVDIRKRLIAQQLDESWNAATAVEDAELVVRGAAAHRSGDQAAIDRILRRAAELDNANRFDPRVVDQVYAVIRDAA
ncbi:MULTISPECIES: hypothetical protein [unclassified Streptomyces]|uniref:hypothetical protein n=1 Tax=unclassified Streptomyces TaxID=2593676 RepID=UPI00278BB9E5|nr:MULTISPECIES: hypothetical protein [unclassified Streptomyces]